MQTETHFKNTLHSEHVDSRLTVGFTCTVWAGSGPAHQPLEVNEQSRIRLLAEGWNSGVQWWELSGDNIMSCLWKSPSDHSAHDSKHVPVALTLRKCAHTAGQRVWKSGPTSADPMNLCQKLFVPGMGKELPDLAVRESAWLSLANQWRHHTT